MMETGALSFPESWQLQEARRKYGSARAAYYGKHKTPTDEVRAALDFELATVTLAHFQHAEDWLRPFDEAQWLRVMRNLGLAQEPIIRQIVKLETMRVAPLFIPA